ncbi:sunset domain-containing protein [Rhizobium lusitanum]|uniref:sunset domain-containing protein n=1 Tax=Rhizobium lusitanum TaxID=293958 RepID=UPI0032B13864
MPKFAALVVLVSAAPFTAAGGYTLIPQPVAKRVMETIDPACNIKGNISIDTGERIYHVPGQKFYAMTRIDPIDGKRWFCSEPDARAAGWRKSNGKGLSTPVQRAMILSPIRHRCDKTLHILSGGTLAKPLPLPV